MPHQFAHTKPKQQDTWLKHVQAVADAESDLVTISSSSSESDRDDENNAKNNSVNVDKAFRDELNEFFGDVSP